MMVNLLKFSMVTAGCGTGPLRLPLLTTDGAVVGRCCSIKQSGKLGKTNEMNENLRTHLR